MRKLNKKKHWVKFHRIMKKGISMRNYKLILTGQKHRLCRIKYVGVHKIKLLSGQGELIKP